MFGLLKLAVYALVGYALYEFFRGLTSDIEAPGDVKAASEGNPPNEAKASHSLPAVRF